MTGLSSWLDDFFGNNSMFEALDREFTSGTWPRVDITEEDNTYVIKADIPGLDKKDISVTVENGTLRIEGEKKEELKKEKDKYFHLERTYGRFSRNFALPEEVDANGIDAKMNNGVLELRLPKTEKARPKAIEVKIN